MDTARAAMEVLRRAEAELRGLMEAALREQRYADVSLLAHHAEAVAQLMRRDGGKTPPKPSRPSTRSPKRASSRKSAGKSRAGGRKGKYPQFVRDGDRLVKIGWSKKKREEYEHRAPRDAVIALARHLTESVEGGDLFAIETLLPVVDRINGEEIPTYQVYLTLAWLRASGAIERRGRDGYVLAQDGVEGSRIQDLWEALPDRGAK